MRTDIRPYPRRRARDNPARICSSSLPCELSKHVGGQDEKLEHRRSKLKVNSNKLRIDRSPSRAPCCSRSRPRPDYLHPGHRQALRISPFPRLIRTSPLAPSFRSPRPPKKTQINGRLCCRCAARQELAQVDAVGRFPFVCAVVGQSPSCRIRSGQIVPQASRSRFASVEPDHDPGRTESPQDEPGEGPDEATDCRARTSVPRDVQALGSGRCPRRQGRGKVQSAQLRRPPGSARQDGPRHCPRSTRHYSPGVYSVSSSLRCFSLKPSFSRSAC